MFQNFVYFSSTFCPSPGQSRIAFRIVSNSLIWLMLLKKKLKEWLTNTINRPITRTPRRPPGARRHRGGLAEPVRVLDTSPHLVAPVDRLDLVRVVAGPVEVGATEDGRAAEEVAEGDPDVAGPVAEEGEEPLSEEEVRSRAGCGTVRQRRGSF